MDTVSALCIGLIAVAGLIIFFAICLYIGDRIQGPMDDYEEL
jgi:hypothetical protein